VIRVAFEYPSQGAGWTGGLNYLRNLFAALEAAPDLGIRPLVAAGRRTELAPELGGAEVLRTPLLDPRDPRRVLRLAWRRATGADPALDRLLRREGVAVLSHSGHLGARARVPSITWIADFQHRHLPALFGATERRLRDAAISAFCRYSRRVLVSSETARADLERWFPRWREKVRVLRFVDCSAGVARPIPRAELEARYGFRGPFLLLPNQFWAHKNHRLVLEALERLRREGRAVLVIATGNTRDYRNPAFFDELMALRSRHGVESSFRVLGLVPYADLAALMRHAVALLNPSRFEGWSTVVEEARSMGKKVLLSDIPVHREQAPERGLYFDPDDAAALAGAMWEAWSGADPEEDRQAEARARAGLEPRRRAFAETYARIVREVL
jgi:glycosyltransferase involved in cell wall biosynthesis